MRFAIFHAVCALWVLWRFWLPMNAPRAVKVAGFVVTLLIAAFPAVTATFFGGLVSPELPAWVLAAGNGCVFALTVLAGLTLLREVVIFLSVLAGRSGERMHRFVQKDRRVAIGMTAAAVGISAFGLRQGLRVPDVKERTVPIEDLPAGLDGMRFAQLSDPHAAALLRAPHMKELVARVNSLSPDLVVITGDLVDGEVDVRSEDVAPLAELRARHGVIAVEGNHEHYLDYEGWMKKIPSLGIRLLRNEWRAVEHNGATLVVGGVTDPWARRFGRELPDPIKAFAGAPEKGPRILLSHQPKHARKYDEAVRFDLQLSGHTHGGQLFALTELVAILNAAFVRGWYALKHARLYVHSGSGVWNGFPVRVGVPSEIAVFTLSRKVLGLRPGRSAAGKILRRTMEA